MPRISSFSRVRTFALYLILLTPLASFAEPAFEDAFSGPALDGAWTTWDGYSAQHPGDPENHAAFQMTGARLSISFPSGIEHNMWWLKHAQATRPFLGSGTYEIKVDSALDGAQQFGLIFEGENHGTFLVFMLYATEQVRGYVERFSYANGQQHKQTFSGGAIGHYVPAAAPFYIRVTVDDHPLPTMRTWTFEWSPNGTIWTQLVSGGLEGGAAHQNAGALQSVGVFAGNQPFTYDAFDARFDYFRYHSAVDSPLPAPSEVVARAGDNHVDLWWNPVAGADAYTVYASTSTGGPYTLLGSTLDTSFTDHAATNGIRTYYVISAFAGGSEGSASSEVAAVPHSPIDLAALPANGLVLALSASELAYVLADGDTVANWPTALGPNAVAYGPETGRPVFVTSGLNGQPTVRFDGVDDFLTLSGAFQDFTSGISLYVVARPTALQHGFKLLALGNGAAQQNIGLGRAGSTSGIQFFTDSGYGPVGWFNTSDGLIVGEPSLISLVQDAGSASNMSYAEVAKNGIPLYGSNVYVPQIADRALNYIGKSYWADGLFQGDIAEVLIYSRALTPAEQGTVRDYLADKYSLPIDGNSGPPLPVSPPDALAAEAGESNVALSWSAVSGAEGYRVYRAMEEDTAIQIADVAETGYTDNTVTNGVTYDYTVTAYDSYAESARSTIATATPDTAPSNPTELPTTGLILSLDAATAAIDHGDNNPVTVWRDGSGEPQNAISGTGAPIVVSNALNGMPVVRFDGVDDFFTLPGGFQDFTGGMTLYMVIRPSVLQSGFKLLALGNGSAQQNIGLGRAGATSGLQYFTDSGSGSVGWFNTGSALNEGEAIVVSVVQDGGAPGGMSYAEVAKNGAPLYGQNVYVPPVTTRGLNYIGKSYWAEGKFEGDIAEVLLYDRALTDVEQAAARHYIAEKYDLTVQ